MCVLTALAVVDPVTVAGIETIVGAVPPDCGLHKAGKSGREGHIEFTSVDVISNRSHDAVTSSSSIAGRSVGMNRRKPMQNARAVQEIVDEGIDRNKVSSDFKPDRSPPAGAQQQLR